MPDHNGSGTISPLKRFLRLLKPDRKEILYIYIYALISGILTLSLPLGIQAVMGLILGGAISTSLVILIIIVTIGTLFSGILKIMQVSVMEIIQRRLFTRSSYELAVRIPRLQMDKLQDEYPPELVNRFFDTITIQKGLPKILIDFSTAALQIFFGLILLAFYHPLFIFFGIIMLLLLSIILRVTSPAGLRTSLMESKYKYKVVYWLQEVARSISTFKMAINSRLPLQYTDKLTNGYLNARASHYKVLIQQYWFIIVFQAIVTAIVLALGSYLVINNQISIGQFVATEIVIILIINSVEKIITIMEVVYDTLTGVEKLGQVTDLALEPDTGLMFDKVDTGKGIELKLQNLTVSLLNFKRPILDGIDLHIRPNERVCIAGYNGAGKSVLARTIAGLQLDFSGSLAYNGIPINNFCVSSLRRHIGEFSSQEDIFRGTLYENICLGHEEVAFSEVKWAAEASGLEEFIRDLPDGYNTVLLPGGRGLPQSVRTKILVARCIVSQPRLLAVEDFHYQLDLADRMNIIRFLIDKQYNWTLIAVSNDPMLAMNCDRIILMDAGKIIAEGTAETLFHNPHFKEIFRLNNFELPTLSNRPSGKSE
jgi:ABC-type bacteriocin/lantibiotic exporter with double-glycine peptidase domain